LEATQGIPREIDNLLAFNPINVFKEPFLPWGNNHLRARFWEVLFRTALFDDLWSACTLISIR